MSADPIDEERFVLAPQVSLRVEDSGALLYDFSTRRLTFVNDRALAALLAELRRPRTLTEASGPAPGASILPRHREAIARLVERGTVVRAERSEARGRSRPETVANSGSPGRELASRLREGLRSPICLTWELTYACNLACVHCLSSSGRRDAGELTTAEALSFIDELEAMQVFYVNIGGGEPTIRPDFFDLVDYATDHHVGVKFSTNGSRITPSVADRLAANGYIDVQISIDGATAEVNDAIRGAGSFETAVRAMERLARAGMAGFKISVVFTRHTADQLDDLERLADGFGAQLRITRLRPSGRGAESWHELRPSAEQQRQLHGWLIEHQSEVLTGDSFFHLSALGAQLPGLSSCGAGRIVCLVDPVGDVYACPFAIHDEFRAGNLRDRSFAALWSQSPLFARLRGGGASGACTSCDAYSACGSGCMAAKFFTGIPADGPDPECVKGYGEAALEAAAGAALPVPTPDHSIARRRGGVPVSVGTTRRRPLVSSSAAPRRDG